MDYLQKYFAQFRNRLWILLLLDNVSVVGAWYASVQFGMKDWEQLAVLIGVPLLLTIILPLLIVESLARPTRFLAQAILHIAPGAASTAGAPKVDQLRFGRELVTSLVNQIYQLASVVDNIELTAGKKTRDLHTEFVASVMPLPLIVLDKSETIVYINDAACKYLQRPATEMVGQNAYTVLDLSFASNKTLDSWLKEARQNTVTADNTWERVRIGLQGQTEKSLQFDLAAHYNKGNSLGYETMLIFFDHTTIYSQDDQAMSFVALSVHELRTPLTLLRGYIEVFDEELGPGLSNELQGFMKKMDAAAQQLAAFVDNILNVAKIEDNQLTLQLHEESWENVLATAVRDMSLRAGVRGVTIKTAIAPDLPKVGVDRYSIYEVLANLLDNAIKYSKGTNEIYVTAGLNQSGLVETSVKDFGLGIDASILPHIFEKFYRNHRNRAQIGGTGLGLYLSKSIVDAHGGQIWVSSKVDEGSTFSFTVLPYAKLAEAGKSGDNSGVVRGAHGWIKNHSLYRD